MSNGGEIYECRRSGNAHAKAAPEQSFVAKKKTLITAQKKRRMPALFLLLWVAKPIQRVKTAASRTAPGWAGLCGLEYSMFQTRTVFNDWAEQVLRRRDEKMTSMECT